MKKALLALLYLFASSPPISADDFLSDLDDISTSSLPVITSASRLTESVLNSPSAVTVIDKEMIAASGFVEIPDTLRLVPGFIVASWTGDTTAVISHGEGWEYPNRMQLLIDGRSTYTNSLSSIDWNTIGVHIEDIDRIEVVRGPAASAYGANSYSAAINIITKAPELDDKLNLRYRTGNAGEQELLFRHAGQIHNFNYRLTASRRHNNGYEDYIEKRVAPGSNQEPFFSDFRDNRDLKDFSLAASLQLNSANKISSQFSYITGTNQMPNLSPGSQPFFKERDRDIEAWSTNIKWEKQFSDQQELQLSFFHNFLNEDDMADTYLLSEIMHTTPAFVPIGLGSKNPNLAGEPDQSFQFGERTSRSHRSDIEAQYSHILTNGLQYVIGTGLRYDTMSSKAFFPTKGTVSNVGQRIFANLQIPLSNFFTLNAGALYEMNSIERPHLSPRASLNLHVTSSQTIRLGYSTAYRIPSLLEHNMDSNFYLASGKILDDVFVSTDDIHAEKVTSFDIGYLGSMTTIPMSWELKAYREDYDDTIVFYQDFSSPFKVIDDYVKKVGNEANSNMYGFEGVITFRPAKSSFIRFHFNHGHMTGNLLSKINLVGKPDEIKSLDDRAPNEVFGLIVAKEVDSWQLSTSFYHVGKIKWDGRGDLVESYDRIDASLKKSFQINSKQSIELKLSGQNITNNRYNEFSTDTDLTFHPKYYASIALVYF